MAEDTTQPTDSFMTIECGEPVNTKTMQLPVHLAVSEYHRVPNVGPLGAGRT